VWALTTVPVPANKIAFPKQWLDPIGGSDAHAKSFEAWKHR
jgi:hypothetical protein